jgi:hypothetical protein
MQIAPAGTPEGMASVMLPKRTEPSLLLLEPMSEIAALESTANPRVATITLTRADSLHPRLIFQVMIVLPL